MSNPMKYIRDLESAGFERKQAEAQVQMVLDAIEGDLVSKADFAVFQERVENRLAQSEQRLDRRFEQTDRRIIESEFRLLTRLGFLVISTTSIAVAVLTWLTKA
ncbi:MAG: hypothetical protein NDI61_10380 [Bdellovibrionaceae bacterium]|nr:hypothetical protein [Pseudobdellovibrionaceae bacterium]